jgi:hypothetical protein
MGETAANSLTRHFNNCNGTRPFALNYFCPSDGVITDNVAENMHRGEQNRKLLVQARVVPPNQILTNHSTPNDAGRSIGRLCPQPPFLVSQLSRNSDFYGHIGGEVAVRDPE